MTDEENQELLDLHDAVRPLFYERRFADACSLIHEKRTEAVASERLEMASELSGFLATCLTMDGRDSEAVTAAREGEELAPASVDAKVKLARVLLNFGNDPEGAKRKAEEALSLMDSRHYLRYSTLALLGTARARCGEVDGAVTIFREISSRPRLESLRRANYVGAFDLALVTELIEANAIPNECREYVQFVASVPSDWPHIRRQLEELLARIAAPSH